jgi:hypothetical protein
MNNASFLTLFPVAGACFCTAWVLAGAVRDVNKQEPLIGFSVQLIDVQPGPHTQLYCRVLKTVKCDVN